jgi:5-carboxymethyl-2-hydroxymuconate isomerase
VQRILRHVRSRERALPHLTIEHFADRLAAPHFALSLDVVENDPTLSCKTNSIHPRLRASG